MSAKCHVWTAPSWQELSSRLQHWSVQPCVRSVSAVHVTAGNNALRGSGPGQKLAFDNVVAHVGCPDRRVDRLCITCRSSSQPFTSRGMSGAIWFTLRARQVPCSAPLGHHCPGHSGEFVGERDGGRCSCSIWVVRKVIGSTNFGENILCLNLPRCTELRLLAMEGEAKLVSARRPVSAPVVAVVHV